MKYAQLVVVLLVFGTSPDTFCAPWEIASRQEVYTHLQYLVRKTGALGFVTAAGADLDGDGVDEPVELTNVTAQGEFTLRIGDVTSPGNVGDGRDVGFIIVDIDTTDASREVAVHAPGPSADDVFVVFTYSDGRIEKAGELYRWPEFRGDGTVLAHDWMGYWLRTRKFVFTGDRKLRLVPQEFYHVGIRGEVFEELPLFDRRSGTERVAILLPGDQAILLVSDAAVAWNERWVLIQAPDGLVGWARSFDALNAIHLPVAD